MPCLVKELFVSADIIADVGCTLDRPATWAERFYESAFASGSDTFDMPEPAEFSMFTLTESNRPSISACRWCAGHTAYRMGYDRSSSHVCVCIDCGYYRFIAGAPADSEVT